MSALRVHSKILCIITTENCMVQFYWKCILMHQALRKLLNANAIQFYLHECNSPQLWRIIFDNTWITFRLQNEQ